MENEVQTEMPKYVCHKEVWALKIKSVKLDNDFYPDHETNGGATLAFSEEGYAPLQVDHKFMSKHQPHVGGYYVVYADGYKSFSPATAFESGYALIK